MQIRKLHSGFTLLELILAMAVTCLLAMSLYASLRIGLKSRDKAREAVDPARQGQVVMELIGRDLENALPPKGVLAGAFEGQDGGSDGVGDLLEFYTINGGIDDGDPTHDDGIKKIDLDVEALPDGTQALVRKVTHDLLAQQVPTPDMDVLCRNVTLFNIRYFANDTWADVWDSTAQGDSVPAAVEVTMDIKRPGAPDSEAAYHVVRTFTLPCNTTASTTTTGVP